MLWYCCEDSNTIDHHLFESSTDDDGSKGGIDGENEMYVEDMSTAAESSIYLSDDGNYNGGD